MLTTYPVLRRGDGIDYPELRESVKLLQDLLKEVGTLPASETSDGFLGPKTEAAVKRFQESQGLIVDGIVGRYTWDVLLQATSDQKPQTKKYPILQIGDGLDHPQLLAQVKILQDLLKKKGCWDGRKDRMASLDPKPRPQSSVSRKVGVLLPMALSVARHGRNYGIIL